MIDAPAYLVDELRRLTGPTGAVENVTEILIDAADGLRVINEVEQLAAFEWAACQTSQGVRRVLFGLELGMTEREAVRLLDSGGTPLSCHLMLSEGPRASLGLLSPIHLDEWVNSPVAPGSTIELRSGMALQVDIIPATGTDHFTTNIEDGVALAG